EIGQAKGFVRGVKDDLLAAEANRWPLYIGQMHQAQAAWESGDLLGLRQLLLAQKQKPGTDQRGFEWYYLWQRLQAADRTLEGHVAEVATVAVSPDGNLLVSGGWDGAVKVWHLPEGQLMFSFGNHGGPVHTVAFSPDGSLFAAAGE